MDSPIVRISQGDSPLGTILSSPSGRFKLRALASRTDSDISIVNVDVAVSGSDFEASASPLLQTALLRVLERVVDPIRNKTLRAVWAEMGSRLGGLGAGSEYVFPQPKPSLLEQLLSCEPYLGPLPL